MIVFMIVLISCSVHDNEDGKTNGNFGVIKKNPLILDYGRDSVERPRYHMVCEASCHPVTRSHGMVARSLSHSVTWSLCHSVTLSLGHLVTWS